MIYSHYAWPVFLLAIVCVIGGALIWLLRK